MVDYQLLAPSANVVPVVNKQTVQWIRAGTNYSGENAMNSRDYAQLLSALLPPKSCALTGKRLGVELQAEGKSLAQLEIRAGEVADGITPFLAVGLLVDWERMLGISPDSSMALQQRRQQVLARINATGGLSRQYFISLAKSLGYRVTLDESEPFRACIGRAGERIWVPEIIWLWIVNIDNAQVPVYRFRTGSSVAG
ncbi:MAG: YmfQ family protein [Sodalis sp. (in: enterobacteria)]|uniref:YmfQ family protein n=1 Tax=Sodalis sp. (in: enterobacteria) TaxID=1898979 RepID=UPI003F3877E6